MTMLDIILEQNRLQTSHYADQDFSDYGHISVASAMKEYATWYAKECLKIAADKATTTLYIPVEDGCHDYKNMCDIVDKDSILNIKLPDHD